MELDKMTLMVKSDSKESSCLSSEEKKEHSSGKVFPYDGPIDDYDSSIGGAEDKRRRSYYGAWGTYTDEEWYNGKQDPVKDVLRALRDMGM